MVGSSFAFVPQFTDCSLKMAGDIYEDYLSVGLSLLVVRIVTALRWYWHTFTADYDK